MDDRHLKYLTNLLKVLKQSNKNMKYAADAEKTMFDATLQHEKKMSEIDGLDYTDEELEANTMRQVENSPIRQRRDSAIDDITEAYFG